MKNEKERRGLRFAIIEAFPRRFSREATSVLFWPRRGVLVRKSVDDWAGTVSRPKGEKSEGGCEARFLAGEPSGLTNHIPRALTA